MQQVGQGGTIRLRVQYLNGAGGLVDPVTPLVDILNPSAVVVVNDAVPLRESLGIYYYDYTLAVAAPLGEWNARFQGVINGQTVTGDDPFLVVPAGSITPAPPAGELITLEELKRSMSIPETDTSRDAELTDVIVHASGIIRDYTNRSFATVSLSATRTFRYDRGGWLEIDEATDVALVKMDGLALVSGVDYVLGPDRGIRTPDHTPVFEWLELFGRARSPEMGFERNEDTLSQFGISRRYSEIEITGTFGWPAVPDAVKRAAILVSRDLLSREEPWTSVSIEDYSVSLGSGAFADSGLRTAAKELLDPYRRWGMG